ncbi:MAG: HTH domain-containing protein [Opitutaceae bacterium]|nr:HTH domain-containing protein [Opitutaceae bacterium]
MPRAVHRAADVSPSHPCCAEFLAADGGCVSGAALAKVVGVSRVAVWGHLHRLETEGFRFTAEHSRGYRLSAQPAGLSPALVRARLPAGAPATFFHATVDSTNEEAERQLPPGAPRPLSYFPPRRAKGEAVSGASGTARPKAISTSPSPSAPSCRRSACTCSLSGWGSICASCSPPSPAWPRA